MFSKNIYVDGLTSDAKYVFQYCRNVEVHNARITTKDSFWECDNVTVYDSELNGEYLAWHSKNIKFVRCHISGEQPLCYMDNVTLEDCTFDAACDRMFEDCTNIKADIKGSVTNIKNPVSGFITADSIGSVTYNEFAKGHRLSDNRKTKSMTYNFDHPAARRHTGSYKWDIFKDDDIIPLWVADMDFETAPCIAEAVRKRAGHSIYGYTLIGQSYYDAIINWFSRRHNWHIEKDWIIYTTGVVPAISATIKALTLPGEKVLVQTPVYNCFFSSIRNQGCQIEENELVRKGDSYVIDFEDFERRCTDEKVTVFLLCNPHNPTGRMWTHEELERMNDICLRHGVKIISDEIHCELAMPGETFSPMAAISDACRDNCVTLNSPSKSLQYRRPANSKHNML